MFHLIMKVMCTCLVCTLPLIVSMRDNNTCMLMLISRQYQEHELLLYHVNNNYTGLALLCHRYRYGFNNA